jgi:WD40 repeat protein
MSNVLVRALILSVLVNVFGVIAGAQGTRTWQQSTMDEFERGTANNISIRSDGGLELAPAFRNLYTSPSTYIWSLATDTAGNIYAATGSPARVFRITPAGNATVIFAPKELQVQCLVVDPAGAIYAATSPDGKIYKIERRMPQKAAAGQPPNAAALPESGASPAPELDPAYTYSVAFNPQTKYIWDMVLDAQGSLYVATGDRGQIFKLARTGESSLFFKSDEAHIRVLALDHEGNLIAGSDGSGLIYRIAPTGEAFVLYSAAKKEITALAIDRAGNIYAAGVGDKRAAVPPTPVPIQVAPVSPPPGVLAPSSSLGVVPSATLVPFASAGTAGGSEIYRIARDGSPLRVWSSHDDLVYAMAFDGHGGLLAGTGNRGKIFAITGTDRYSDLLKASAGQVTAFANAPGGGLYVSTSNFGKLFLLGPGPARDGNYESDIFDAHIFSRWGRAEVRSRGAVDLYARTGNVDNPDRNWSPWKLVDTKEGARLDVPAARFVQWKAVLKSGGVPPALDSVLLNYLSKNVAPEIEDIAVTPGLRYQPPPKVMPGTVMAAPSVGGSATPQFDTPPPSARDRDSIGVRWNAHDDNDDDLIYSLYYRGDGEQRWLLLKDKLDDKFYSFDANLLPDGGYTLKVMASDAPSHSPQEVLTAEKESPRFEVDTTPPVIQQLKANVTAGEIRVLFRATDSFSPIKHAEYSVDASDWQDVDPVDQISDAKTEAYDFIAAPPGDAPDWVEPAAADSPRQRSGQHAATAAHLTEHIVVVRVYDRNDNMATAKYVVRSQ